MGVSERDPYTGHQTTGHEWNGIKELNTPVPRPVYFFLIVTASFGFVYWLLMPSWPLGTTYFKGLLGSDQRAVVQQSLQEAKLERAQWTDRIARESIAQVQTDPRLMQVVRETGPSLFGDNCAACHGRDARGNRGFPDLTADSWLWGGTPEAIAETIRVGINSTHPDSRTSQMPAFGRDGVLARKDIDNVVAYVRTLSDLPTADASPEAIAAGKSVFAANCAACHGEDGKGNTEMGSRNLTNRSFLYGSDTSSLVTTVFNGRQGHMPTWEHRLSALDRKILTLYLLDLRAARR
ncbi:cytochrome-c oxidase, cbb3-type subunit III [Bradyrhizobium sp.]|uniref:cytochrome-c oxidase, cbb3-type subunit III n=1 Tax=Bradyrhizobium sp. TaxID=376 RepID=UPI002381F02B|nr:cytochrome-c oxidase, cbb3-type subunit III [Bradyrhizobium sp.]MDE2377918.1 cytochrome-c oxidase, cbb3-type subunit III [Bradyrhizobium sp.]